MGAPVGNQNASRSGGRIWAAAIERALERRKPANERVKAIDELADALLNKCADGDLQALKELGDRLDGKPAQVVSGVDGGPLTIQIVRFADDKTTG